VIKDECFLCDRPIFAKGVCSAHYHRARRLAKKSSPLELAIDLLIWKEAFAQAEKRLCEEMRGGDEHDSGRNV
jgi:hypothetical protein